MQRKLAARFVQSRLPFVVSPPPDVSVCPSPALAGQVVWSQSFDTPTPPLLLLCVALSWGLWCSILSPWPIVAPSPSVVSRLGFFLWRLFRLGLEGCGPVMVPPFFFFFGGGGSPSLVLVVFAWRFQLFCCPSSLSFLELFAGVLSSRFQCLLIARGG